MGHDVDHFTSPEGTPGVPETNFNNRPNSFKVLSPSRTCVVWSSFQVLCFHYLLCIPIIEVKRKYLLKTGGVGRHTSKDKLSYLLVWMNQYLKLNTDLRLETCFLWHVIKIVKEIFKRVSIVNYPPTLYYSNNMLDLASSFHRYTIEWKKARKIRKIVNQTMLMIY